MRSSLGGRDLNQYPQTMASILLLFVTACLLPCVTSLPDVTVPCSNTSRVTLNISGDYVYECLFPTALAVGAFGGGNASTLSINLTITRAFFGLFVTGNTPLRVVILIAGKMHVVSSSAVVVMILPNTPVTFFNITVDAAMVDLSSASQLLVIHSPPRELFVMMHQSVMNLSATDVVLTSVELPHSTIVLFNSTFVGSLGSSFLRSTPGIGLHNVNVSVITTSVSFSQGCQSIASGANISRMHIDFFDSRLNFDVDSTLVFVSRKGMLSQSTLSFSSSPQTLQTQPAPSLSQITVRGSSSVVNVSKASIVDFAVALSDTTVHFDFDSSLIYVGGGGSGDDASLAIVANMSMLLYRCYVEAVRWSGLLNITRAALCTVHDASLFIDNSTLNLTDSYLVFSSDNSTMQNVHVVLVNTRTTAMGGALIITRGTAAAAVSDAPSMSLTASHSAILLNKSIGVWMRHGGISIVMLSCSVTSLYESSWYLENETSTMWVSIRCVDCVSMTSYLSSVMIGSVVHSMEIRFSHSLVSVTDDSSLALSSLQASNIEMTLESCNVTLRQRSTLLWSQQSVASATFLTQTSNVTIDSQSSAFRVAASFTDVADSVVSSHIQMSRQSTWISSVSGLCTGMSSTISAESFVALLSSSAWMGAGLAGLNLTVLITSNSKVELRDLSAIMYASIGSLSNLTLVMEGPFTSIVLFDNASLIASDALFDAAIEILGGAHITSPLGGGQLVQGNSSFVSGDIRTACTLASNISLVICSSSLTWSGRRAVSPPATASSSFLLAALSVQNVTVTITNGSILSLNCTVAGAIFSSCGFIGFHVGQHLQVAVADNSHVFLGTGHASIMDCRSAVDILAAGGGGFDQPSTHCRSADFIDVLVTNASEVYLDGNATWLRIGNSRRVVDGVPGPEDIMRASIAVRRGSSLTVRLSDVSSSVSSLSVGFLLYAPDCARVGWLLNPVELTVVFSESLLVLTSRDLPLLIPPAVTSANNSGILLPSVDVFDVPLSQLRIVVTSNPATTMSTSSLRPSYFWSFGSTCSANNGSSPAGNGSSWSTLSRLHPLPYASHSISWSSTLTSVTHSSTNSRTIPSATHTASRERPLPLVLPILLKRGESAALASSVIQVLTTVGGGSAAASAMLTSMPMMQTSFAAVKLAVQCHNQDDGTDDGVGGSAEPSTFADLFSNPLQVVTCGHQDISLGLGVAAGATLGNTMVLVLWGCAVVVLHLVIPMILFAVHHHHGRVLQQREGGGATTSTVWTVKDNEELFTPAQPGQQDGRPSLLSIVFKQTCAPHALRRTLRLAPIPGSIIIPIGILAQPTMSAALYVFAFPTVSLSTCSATIAAVCFVAWLLSVTVPVCIILSRLWKHTLPLRSYPCRPVKQRRFPLNVLMPRYEWRPVIPRSVSENGGDAEFTEVEDDEERRHTQRAIALAEDALSKAMGTPRPSDSEEPYRKGGSDTAVIFASRFALWVDTYTQTHAWYLAIDLGYAILSGIITGLGFATRTCDGVRATLWLLLVLTVGLGCVTAVLRPYSAWKDIVVSLINAVCTTVVLISSLAHDDRAASIAALIQSIASVLIAVSWLLVTLYLKVVPWLIRDVLAPLNLSLLNVNAPAETAAKKKKADARRDRMRKAAATDARLSANVLMFRVSSSGVTPLGRLAALVEITCEFTKKHNSLAEADDETAPSAAFLEQENH